MYRNWREFVSNAAVRGEKSPQLFASVGEWRVGSTLTWECTLRKEHLIPLTNSQGALLTHTLTQLELLLVVCFFPQGNNIMTITCYTFSPCWFFSPLLLSPPKVSSHTNTSFIARQWLNTSCTTLKNYAEKTQVINIIWDLLSHLCFIKYLWLLLISNFL